MVWCVVCGIFVDREAWSLICIESVRVLRIAEMERSNFGFCSFEFGRGEECVNFPPEIGM